MRHLLVLIDYSTFKSLKEKITYSAIDMIFCKLNFTKINAKNFNQQIFFEFKLSYTAIIELPEDGYINKCKLIMRFGLPYKC